MNLLMVGSGRGSWAIRGEQLGAALGARVTSQPTAADWAWADRVVLVKRAGRQWAPTAQAAQVPIVWDALDCWRQPADHERTEAAVVATLWAEQALIQPGVTIAATQAQAAALRAAVYLPHHSWPGLEPTPARATIQTVGYQGNAAYLGRWLGIVSTACGARGWRFVVNPPDLMAVDLLVAFRDGPWDGWICRQWKSGVKLVNAIAAGRPILTQDTAAAREIGAPGSIVETEADLARALDGWTDAGRRAAVVDICRTLAPRYGLAAVADQYRALLEDTRATWAA